MGLDPQPQASALTPTLTDPPRSTLKPDQWGPLGAPSGRSCSPPRADKNWQSMLPKKTGRTSEAFIQSTWHSAQ